MSRCFRLVKVAVAVPAIGFTVLASVATFVGQISCGDGGQTFTYVGGPPLQANGESRCTPSRAGYIAPDVPASGDGSARAR